jgi:hypothetical protein
VAYQRREHFLSCNDGCDVETLHQGSADRIRLVHLGLLHCATCSTGCDPAWDTHCTFGSVNGRHPEGLLIYDRSGWMSAQIVSDPKLTVPATNSREKFLEATPADKVDAIDGFYAYFGTWTVDNSGQPTPNRSSLPSRL